MEMSRHDVSIDWYILSAFDRHHNLLHGSISGTLTHAVQCNLNLTCTIQNTGNSICCRHSKVIVAMRRYYGLVDIRDIVHQISDLCSILMREAISGSIRNVHDSSTGLDHSFYHPCQELVIRTTCVLSIELHIINKPAGILHRSYSPFKYLVLIGIELMSDMIIRCAYTGMDPFQTSIMQCIHSHVYILLQCTCQGAEP